MRIRGRDRGATRLVRRAAGITAMAVLALLVPACSSGGHRTPQAGVATHTKAVEKATTTTSIGPHVTITPANGTADADPSAGIAVAATDGTLSNVTVRTSGDPVAGLLSPGGTVWRSERTLDVSQTYTVTARASRPGGGTVTSLSTFRTLTPSRTFETKIFEGYGQTYGVGMPIILDFSQPIVEKAAVEQALQVATSKPVIGAWYWDDSCGMAATCAYFRPRDYWPAGTVVSFVGRLDGVQGAPGLYGTHTLTQTFDIIPPRTAPRFTRTAGSCMTGRSARGDRVTTPRTEVI